jgi:Domain of unknown function (DUF4442)
MPSLHKFYHKSLNSSFNLWLLNKSLRFLIPFNKPHGLQIVKTYDTGIEVKLPYKSSNLNHLKSIHACALAVLSEYSCGLVLAVALPEDKFRLIIKELKMEYHYQAKTDVFVSFHLDKDFIQKKIIEHLKSDEKILVDLKVEVFDLDRNNISTAYVQWQIKNWESVKEK